MYQTQIDDTRTASQGERDKTPFLQLKGGSCMGSGLSLRAAGLAADDMVYHDPMMESVGPHVWLDYTQARPHHKHFCPKKLLLAQFQLIGVVLDKNGSIICWRFIKLWCSRGQDILRLNSCNAFV